MAEIPRYESYATFGAGSSCNKLRKNEVAGGLSEALNWQLEHGIGGRSATIAIDLAMGKEPGHRGIVVRGTVVQREGPQMGQALQRQQASGRDTRGLQAKLLKQRQSGQVRYALSLIHI